MYGGGLPSLQASAKDLHPHFVHHENSALQFSLGSLKRVYRYVALDAPAPAVDGIQNQFLRLASIVGARSNWTPQFPDRQAKFEIQ
jgi:hypothetical protein